MLDRYDCYELCVQSPRHIVSFLREAHGGGPLLLREDFCGTAAVARRWAWDGKKRGDSARAFAIDLDPATVAKARALADADGVGDRIVLAEGDALEHAGDESRMRSVGARDIDAADVIFIGNFSIGYIHGRPVLQQYLRRCRERLARGGAGWGGGILACDTYGGASAFRLGGFTRRHPGRAGETIHYTWAHEQANPMTGHVTNSISFRVETGGEIVHQIPRAFEYRWRLWSLPELRDSLLEAGFSAVEFHKDINIAPGQRPAPVTDPAELGEDWIVLVIARA
ncbi:MAG: hypothetical protein IT436_16635 [Phycisphaerales bacterium]|nr:hypothetical protein [Phycisphaerales bacterium]